MNEPHRTPRLYVIIRDHVSSLRSQGNKTIADIAVLMSGFEVAGIVFGALPLLIDGLEHYRDGLESLQTAWRYREVIVNLVTTFRAVHAAYLTLCERVLRQLMLTDEEYAELLEDPKSKKWSSPEIDAGVRSCLGHNYRPFLDIVARLNTDLIKFASKLDLDPDNNLVPRWLSDANVDSFRKKLSGKSNRLFKSINVGMESGRLKAALDKIDTDLRLLERMVPENVVLPTYSANPRKRSIWRHVRESAKQLFEAMSTNWACTNAHNHTASLQLEPRDTTATMGHPPRFKVLLFVCGASSTNTANRPGWHDVEIESAEDYAPQKISRLSAAGRGTPVGTNKKNSVSISEITASYSAITLTVPKSTIITGLSNGPTQRIQNICQCLQSSPTSGGCVGFIKQHSWRHEIFMPQKQTSQPPSWFNLQDIILGLQNTNLRPVAHPRAKKQMTLPEKYHVAYILASSVLQLADTPWLSESWGLDDVYYTDTQPQFRKTRPFVKNEFAPTNSNSNSTSRKPNRLILNKMTFALGVVLIELFYERPLEVLRESVDLDMNGNATPMTDQLTATRLLNDIRQQQGDNFADAVQRCLYGSFNSAHDTFDNPTLQGQFYEGVVVPLKKIYDAL